MIVQLPRLGRCSKSNISSIGLLVWLGHPVDVGQVVFEHCPCIPVELPHIFGVGMVRIRGPEMSAAGIAPDQGVRNSAGHFIVPQRLQEMLCEEMCRSVGRQAAAGADFCQGGDLAARFGDFNVPSSIRLSDAVSRTFYRKLRHFRLTKEMGGNTIYS